VPGTHSRFIDLRSQAQEGEEGEEVQKENFGGFIGRLYGRNSVRGGRGEAQEEKEILQEGEPTVDLGGDGGPILGGGPAETQDKNNGGVATSGPKKTLKQFREKK
jgi:hypothetical protein